MARDLTVVSWGGTYQDAQRKVYFEPFKAETGIPLVEDSWDGGVGALRAKVEGGAVPWDVVQVEAEELSIGCDEGLFEPHRLGEARRPRRLPARRGQRLRRRRDHLVDRRSPTTPTSSANGGPKTWADFWNVEKFPGKRAMRKGPKYTLEFALMADGVAPKDVYSVLATREGVERAFNKLDEIKPHIDLVGGRRPAAAAAGLGRGGDDLGLQRPARRAAQGGQGLPDRLAGQHLRRRHLGRSSTAAPTPKTA